MTRGRRTAIDRDEALGANVRVTLATAMEVLEHFHQSLVKSGFVEGADSYSKLAETLVGQRMWSVTRGVDTDAEFTTIAALARNIHEILAPYSRAMMRVSTLGVTRREGDAAEATDAAGGAPAAPVARAETASAPIAQSAAAPADTIGAGLLRLLAGSPQPMSVTAIRAHCRCDRRLLTAALEALEQAGRVKRQDRGGRALYSLNPAETPRGR